MTLYAIDGFAPEIGPECFVAPNAVLIGRVRLMPGASVWFGAVLRADNDWITLGEGTNVQDNAVIHADPGEPVMLGRGVTVGHGAIVHSASVGDHSLIGMGATLLNRARIGSYCVIGAGALIAEGKEFADGSLVVGAPGRLVRTLGEDHRRRLEGAAGTYIEKSKRYRDGLAEIHPQI